MPLPFLSFGFGEFKVVTKINNEEVFYLGSESKLQRENKKSFLDKWSGIVLLAERGSESGEKDYDVKRKSEFIESLAIPFVLALGLFMAY